MGDPQGNLLNSPVDVVIDTALLVLLVATYAIQVYRIQSAGTIFGISPFYLLFNSYFICTHCSLLLLKGAYSYPSNGTHDPVIRQIYEGKLHGLEAFGGVLGLLQVFCHWCGCITIVIMASFRSFQHSHSSDLTESEPPHGGHQLGPKTLSSLVFLYCAVFTFPAFGIVSTNPIPDTDPVVDIFIGFLNFYMMPIKLFFAIAQFVPQVYEALRLHGDSGVLSVPLLALNAGVEIAIGIRWLQRIGPQTWSGPTLTSPVYVWGYPAFNYFIQGAGLTILCLVYWIKARQGQHLSL